MAVAIVVAAVLCGGVSADHVLIRPWGDNAIRVQMAPNDWTLTVRNKLLYNCPTHIWIQLQLAA